MNVLLLKAWLGACAPGLIGSRVRGVTQVDGKTVALELTGADVANCIGRRVGAGPAPARDGNSEVVNRRAGAGPAPTQLLISILEAYPSLALIPGDDPLMANDFPDGSFAKALRFHLHGAEVAGVQQEGFDRSVSFSFTHTDIYGRSSVKTLRIELVGRASNAYLLSERNMVVSMMKRVPPGRNSVRRVVTGKTLPSPPPLGKYVASAGGLHSLAAELEAASAAAPEEPLRELLTRRVAGGDVHLWDALEPLVPVEHDLKALQDFIAALQAGELTAQLFGLDSRSANDVALAQWQAARSGERAPAAPGAGGQRDDFRQQQIAAQLALAQRADELEALALELQRHARALSSRDAEVALLRGWQAANPDWAARVALDKSAEDNAAELIQYAQRLRRARGRLEELAASSAAYGPSLLGPLGGQTEPNGEANTAGRSSSAPTRPAADPLAREIPRLQKGDIKYLRFVSSDGLHILVGQSDRSNDELVRLYGSSRHLWLHVRDYPGSHVILLSNGADVPERTLQEAAVIAGYYSQGRGETDLPVSYTPLKQLRRPRGGKPGQVLKLSEKVIRVNPMRFEELRDRLRV